MNGKTLSATHINFGDHLMSTALSTLKFVNAKRLVAATDPIQFRRQKMLKKLDEQIMMAAALADGRQPLVTRTRRVRDGETNERLSLIHI